MYKEILETIAGVEAYPVISLLLFSAIFGTVLYWTLRVDRAQLARLAAQPLNADDALPPEAGRSDGGAR